MAAPRPLPSWFLPLTKYKYGLGPRPTDAPKIVKGGRYQWVLDEWVKFDKWWYWRHHGGTRPTGIWTKVPDWAWTIARLLGQKEHNKPPEPVLDLPGTPVPSKSKGHGGLYYYTYDNKQQSDAELVSLCKQYGLWVALLVHELDRKPIPAYDTEATRKRLQSEGIVVVASGWCESGFDLDKQAEAAAGYSQGYDEYLLNAEYSWAYPTPGFSQMQYFAPKLRAKLGPTMPLSLSCMWGQQTHMKPLLEAGLSAVRPQCYMNEWPHQNPADAVRRLGWDQADLKNGIPSNMVEATYGSYGAYVVQMTTYAAPNAEAKLLGMKASSAWAGESLDTPNIRVLAGFS